MDILRAIAALPADYADLQALGKSIAAALADPAVKAEIATHPGVAAIVGRISAEWRTVENAGTNVRKSHFWNFFGTVSDLARAAKTLEADVVAEEHDPAIASALQTMPATLAALSKISADWVRVEKDLGTFK